MSATFEMIAKEAANLTEREKLSLAGMLLAGADPDVDAEAAWEVEIQDRLRAVREGRVVGVPLEDVLRQINQRSAP